MTNLLLQPETYFSLLSLTLLEIVLGIDNVIFISILAGKLPDEQRDKARKIGLVVALVGRLLLLLSIVWLAKLTKPLLYLGTIITLSGKDLVLLLGGLFLIIKSTHEIYEKVEAPQHESILASPKGSSFASIILQIIVIDMVFSLDSIITAVGLVKHIGIMVTAILISLGLMLAASNMIGGFIDRHPSIKVLALSFLLMIGTMLTAEGLHFHFPKGYVYSSLVFALFVEFINIRVRTKTART